MSFCSIHTISFQYFCITCTENTDKNENHEITKKIPFSSPACPHYEKSSLPLQISTYLSIFICRQFVKW